MVLFVKVANFIFFLFSDHVTVEMLLHLILIRSPFLTAIIFGNTFPYEGTSEPHATSYTQVKSF